MGDKVIGKAWKLHIDSKVEGKESGGTAIIGESLKLHSLGMGLHT